MRTFARTAVALLAASTFASLSACAPPEKKSDSNSSGAATAASAADLGGMDALVTAAKKEGKLNVIALPPDWANYGEIIKAFKRQVRHQGQLRPARRGQPGRDQRRQPAQGHRAARPTSSTSASRSRWPTPTLFAPYKVATFDDIPDSLKDAERHLGQRLRRLHVDRLRLAPRCPPSAAVADLLKPEYKGKVALNGDPTPGRRGVQRRGDGLAGQRRFGRQHRARVSTTSASSRRPATSCRSTPPRRPSSPARRRSSSTGTT